MHLGLKIIIKNREKKISHILKNYNRNPDLKKGQKFGYKTEKINVIRSDYLVYKINTE